MWTFLLQLPLHQAVAPVHHFPDEGAVLLQGTEIAAAPQHQGLVDGVLEPVMGLLGDTVFVGLSCIYQGGLEPIVVQELGVAVVQGPAATAPHLVRGGRGVVRADHPGTAAQLPQGVLQSLLQGQEGLSGGHLGVAPPRMAQHQLEQQVAIGPAADSDSQGVAVGEVQLGLAARGMLLGEINLLVRAVESAPPELAEGPVIAVAGCAAARR